MTAPKHDIVLAKRDNRLIQRMLFVGEDSEEEEEQEFEDDAENESIRANRR